MQKAVQRLDGVQKTTVSLNRGLVTVILRPQNHFSLDALRRKVRDAGFTAGPMEITAAGEIIRWQDHPAFRVDARSDLVLLLAPSARDYVRVAAAAGTKATVTGTVAPSRRKSELDTLLVTRFDTHGP